MSTYCTFTFLIFQVFFSYLREDQSVGCIAKIKKNSIQKRWRINEKETIIIKKQKLYVKICISLISWGGKKISFHFSLLIFSGHLLIMIFSILVCLYFPTITTCLYLLLIGPLFLRCLFITYWIL